MTSGIHPIRANKYFHRRELYEMSDDEFKDMMVRRLYKQGKLSKEDAFLELV
jgi:hypothetical protein